jgi:hypothetical protein
MRSSRPSDRRTLIRLTPPGTATRTFDPIVCEHTTSQCRSESKATVARIIAAGEQATALAHPRRRSAPRVDFALLFCALFLQRFSLSLGNSLLSLDIVPAAFILIYQFAAGRLLILYDRLLWFLVLALAVTTSLLLNFKRQMLSSYSELIVVYFLFTLSRSVTRDRYRDTLWAFQFLVLVLSFLAIAQFFAQFFVDGRELVQFFGIVPDYLLASYAVGGVNTIIPITEGSSLIKSNAIFLTEPSTLSQITALAIIVEVLEFRRPRYLLPLTFGFLLAYSGTGLLTLLLCLPLTGLVQIRVILYTLLISVFVVCLSLTGIIDLSVFLSRTGEFQDTRASGFTRFVAPFWVAQNYLNQGSLRGFLIGNGPGTTADFLDRIWYSGNVTGTWIKLFYEYGVIGVLSLGLFLIACCRRTWCPGILLVAIYFSYVFLGGNLLQTPFLIMMIVLVSLSLPQPRHGRDGPRTQYQRFLIPQPRPG